MFVHYAVLGKKKNTHSHTNTLNHRIEDTHWLIINPPIEKQLKFFIVFMFRVDSKYLLRTCRHPVGLVILDVYLHFQIVKLPLLLQFFS